MKKTFYRPVFMTLLALFIITGVGHKAIAQDVSVSFQTFYDNLAPYGQWVEDPQYGNVWVPNEEGDFRPYGSRGHWVMTDYGNTWVSDEPFGWAVYHYGRWTYDQYYGWVWVPGYDWAPAWVSWRYSSGYCGWAPLGPGFSGGDEFNCPDSWWVFVGPTYMYRPDYYHYRMNIAYNREYIGRTTVINNRFVDNGTRVQFNFGPRREDIERDTRQRVQVYNLQQSGRPGAAQLSGQRLNIYRPEVNRATVGEARPANVFRASHPLGAAQPATNITANRTPAFRQELQQRQQGNQGNGQNGQRPVNNQPQPNNRQTLNNNNQPGRPAQPGQPQQPVNRPQFQNQQNTQQPVNRQPQQEQPRQAQPQQQQPRQVQPQPQQQPRQEQPQPQQQPRQEQPQQHSFQAPPRPQVQPQPQRTQPQPQRSQPQPQPRQQPAPQPQRSQPQPQQQPRQQPQPERQQGREEGGRR